MRCKLVTMIVGIEQVVDWENYHSAMREYSLAIMLTHIVVIDASLCGQ